MTLIVFIFGVFFICMAMLWTEGLWGNAVTFVNVIISGMMAVAFWEPVANALEKQMPSYTYVLDIIAVWGVFALTMGVLRAVTDYLSKYKVRFHRLMENIGNIAMSIIVAGTMAFFATWTLHLAPLAPNPMRGADIANSAWPRIWSAPISFMSGGTMGGGERFPADGKAGLYRQRRVALESLEGFRTP